MDARTRLAEAQRLAHLGHWEYYIPEGRSVWSDELYRILGYEPGQVEPSPEVILEHSHPEEKVRVRDILQRAFVLGEGFVTDFRFYTAQGDLRWGHARGQVFRDDHGHPLYAVGTGQDITEQKLLQLKLEEAKQCLEQRVADSTRELRLANQILEQERQALRQKNIALKELLAQVDDGRQALARQMQKNIGQIAMPLLHDLEAAADESLRPKVAMLTRCLTNVVDPTIDNLQQRAPDLTPRQLQVCNLIVSGHSCKEIAGMLNNSCQTILKQRKGIRRKLGLTGKRINLASFLKSMGLSDRPPRLSGRRAEHLKTNNNNGLEPVSGTPLPPKGSQ
jgi:PAS domain S-box-containing protein